MPVRVTRKAVNRNRSKHRAWHQTLRQTTSTGPQPKAMTTYLPLLEQAAKARNQPRLFFSFVAESMTLSSSEPRTLVVEGWRRILHSFAVVNHYHLLALARHPQWRLFHVDRPYLGVSWKPLAGLFPAADEAFIAGLEAPPADLVADVSLRMAFPHDFTPSSARRLLVFVTSDAGMLPDSSIVGHQSLGHAQRNSGAVIITPSNWSRHGLIHAGADPEQVFVVPHGVDSRWFFPIPAEQRHKQRQALKWDGRHVIMSVGAMSGNKGIHHICRAVAALVPRYPSLLLYLKGSDHTYLSQQALSECLQVLSAEERQRLEGRIHYNGEAVSFRQIGLLLQSADLYVSPYSAEGFNMPVLESMACGLPVICSAGGPTDDFIHPTAVQRINTSVRITDNGRVLIIDFDHLVALLDAALRNSDWRQQAAAAGPPWVAAHYSWDHVVTRLLAVCTGEAKAADGS